MADTEQNSKLVRVDKEFVEFMDYRYDEEKGAPVRYQVEECIKKDTEFMRAFRAYKKNQGGD